MSSGRFSRHEIVQLAASNFPDVPWKTLDGTIGQYWSDSVNPKWSTWKAIQARGLSVLEDRGRRHITGGGRTNPSVSSNGNMPPETFSAQSPRAVADIQRRCGDSDLRSAGEGGHADTETRELWNSKEPRLWEFALDRYWTHVKPHNLALEREMDQLDAGIVRAMSPQAWYGFLLERYFRWKYTAQNRYASTTKWLRTYEANNDLPALHLY